MDQRLWYFSAKARLGLPVRPVCINISLKSQVNLGTPSAVGLRSGSMSTPTGQSDSERQDDASMYQRQECVEEEREGMWGARQ